MINYAYAMGGVPQAQGSVQPSPLMSMLPIILIFVIFYFLLIKPQKKRQQEHQEMVKALKKNDEVITNGGIHGTVVNVKDASVILRVDDNCRIEVQKSAIATIKKAHE